MTRFRLGPWWCLLAVGCLAALSTMVLGSVRFGGYVLAASLAAAGLVRIVMPHKLVGALAIRSRWLDGVFYFALAIAAGVIFAIVTLGPSASS